MIGKLIGLTLVLLVVGAMTATAYEFTVSFDEKLNFISVQFPGAQPTGGKPLQTNYPSGAPIASEFLGSVHYCDLGGKHACVLQLGDRTYIKCPTGCNCWRVNVYDGKGNLLRTKDPVTGMFKSISEFTPLKNYAPQFVHEIKPLGQILIFKSGGKKIRYLTINDKIAKSPPSDD